MLCYPEVISVRFGESEVLQTPWLQLNVIFQFLALSNNVVPFSLQVINFYDNLDSFIGSTVALLLLQRFIRGCFDGAEEDVVALEVGISVDVLDQGKSHHIGVEINEPFEVGREYLDSQRSRHGGGFLGGVEPVLSTLFWRQQDVLMQCWHSTYT